VLLLPLPVLRERDGFDRCRLHDERCVRARWKHKLPRCSLMLPLVYGVWHLWRGRPREGRGGQRLGSRGGAAAGATCDRACHAAIVGMHALIKHILGTAPSATSYDEQLVLMQSRRFGDADALDPK